MVRRVRATFGFVGRCKLCSPTERPSVSEPNAHAAAMDADLAFSWIQDNNILSRSSSCHSSSGSSQALPEKEDKLVDTFGTAATDSEIATPTTFEG